MLLIIFDKVIIIGLILLYYKVKKLIIKSINKNNESFNNLDLYDYQEIIASKISDIFKNNKYNLGEYPNVAIKSEYEIFKHNKFLPECCMYYSNYSSDKGCPCITPEQQNYLQRRGLNRSDESFIHEYDLKNIFFSPTNVFKKNKDEIFLKHNTYIEKS